MSGGHKNAIWSIKWSPDNSKLASGSDDKTIIIWDIKKKMIQSILKDHSETISYLEWSPDGKHLASCSEDESIKIWDITQEKCITTIKGYIGNVLNQFPIKWSNDGKEIFIYTNEERIISVDPFTGTMKNTILSFDDDFMGLIEEQFNRAFSCESVMSISWDEKATLFALADVEEGEIFLVDLKNGNCLNKTDSDGDSAFVSLSPNGKYLLRGPRRIHNVDIYTTNPLEEIATIFGDSEHEVHTVAWRHDGTIFAIDSDNGENIKIWEAETGLCVKVLDYESKKVYEIENPKELLSFGWSPDGKKIAAGDNEGNIVIWNLENGTKECILECNI